jgi:hypothetical protein
MINVQYSIQYRIMSQDVFFMAAVKLLQYCRTFPHSPQCLVALKCGPRKTPCFCIVGIIDFSAVAWCCCRLYYSLTPYLRWHFYENYQLCFLVMADSKTIKSASPAVALKRHPDTRIVILIF